MKGSTNNIVRIALGAIILGALFITLAEVALHRVDQTVCATATDQEFQQLHCGEVQ